jgi:hypothetical protein
MPLDQGKMSGRRLLNRRIDEALKSERLGRSSQMSQFLYLYRMADAARQEAMGTPERAQQSMQRWIAWMKELDREGHLKDRGQPLERTGKVVRGQQKTVTDGPYPEAKDVVGGFTLVEARDIDQAVELSRGCPILEGGGSVEVRPVMRMDY